MGVATVSAMTSGLAPGYWALTVIVGGMRSGYCATGSTRMERRPARTMNTDSTMERTGLRRKTPARGLTEDASETAEEVR